MCEISDHEQRQAHGAGATVEAMLGTAFALCALGVRVYTSYYPWEAYAGGDCRRWCEGAARACQIVRSWEPLVGRVAPGSGSGICKVRTAARAAARVSPHS